MPLPTYTPKDFATDQDVRWCPGCGDYAVLTAVRKALPKLGHRREDYVFVSGIGCAARFPYYMNTYGLHTIHGRSLAVATGIKLANPELQICVVSGDGDLFSIGGNHTIHAMRRNVDLTVLLLNNRIYGLTKGQYSPTSEQGKVTKSSPMGSPDFPVNPIALAVASGCTLIARTIDVDMKHFDAVYVRAMEHKGTSFVEVYQDCNIFNHKAWFYASQKESKFDATVVVEHGKPLIFGKDRDKGIRLRNGSPEVVTIGHGVSEADLLVHDETDRTLAFVYSQMAHPEFPEPIGVLYAETGKPTYDELVHEQIHAAREQRKGTEAEALQQLLHGAETWTVEQ
ncbi:MAG: 2-oxoacid:ferredoxin oxidoreductase subunit beta [Phycisphaeraceae bacterium]|nr:2-oxoacid:ferredoxin oxidoreductase subunit beta [Phycisphaerales bacterium]MCB9861613.1 2-oxoacid:ferredoxin oxidoreductase subunit beta [Phycisphaeraceae bacterium]